MSHQTGIKASESLKHIFGKCRDGNIRALKVAIDECHLELSVYREAKGTWEEDFDKSVLPLAEPYQPTYILYRLDSKNGVEGYEWLLISWSPDDSPIREKMVYASTKATLKREFGSGQIKEELHATNKDEVSLRGLKQHRAAAVIPAPLTNREEELAQLSVDTSNVSIDSRSQTLGGVVFPLLESARSAIQDLADGRVNYVQLRIDMEAEQIHCTRSSEVPLDRLAAQVPPNQARYHLYNFKHTYEGDHLESVVFIYSMPGYSCPIKERMLYSSCKATLLETIEHSLGLGIEKKLEIDSGSELTEEFLQEEIHPKKCLHRPKFEKPKGPPNRGAKRLTKTQQ